MANPAQTASRDSGGSKALAKITAAETPVPVTKRLVTGTYSGRSRMSRRRTVDQSAVMRTRNAAYTTANAWPPAPEASAVKTASNAIMPIWTKTTERVRPSSRPWSSRYVVPLTQAIQIKVNTTAKSITPLGETCSPR